MLNNPTRDGDGELSTFKAQSLLQITLPSPVHQCTGPMWGFQSRPRTLKHTWVGTKPPVRGWPVHHATQLLTTAIIWKKAFAINSFSISERQQTGNGKTTVCNKLRGNQVNPTSTDIRQISLPHYVLNWRVSSNIVFCFCRAVSAADAHHRHALLHEEAPNYRNRRISSCSSGGNNNRKTNHHKLGRALHSHCHVHGHVHLRVTADVHGSFVACGLSCVCSLSCRCTPGQTNWAAPGRWPAPSLSGFLSPRPANQTPSPASCKLWWSGTQETGQNMKHKKDKQFRKIRIVLINLVMFLNFFFNFLIKSREKRINCKTVRKTLWQHKPCFFWK